MTHACEMKGFRCDAWVHHSSCFQVTFSGRIFQWWFSHPLSWVSLNQNHLCFDISSAAEHDAFSERHFPCILARKWTAKPRHHHHDRERVRDTSLVNAVWMNGNSMKIPRGTIRTNLSDTTETIFGHMSPSRLSLRQDHRVSFVWLGGRNTWKPQ